MADKENKTNWIPTIVSIVIGVLITIGATWYTIYTTKEEVQEAENERLTKVKENLVAIIEEHIVNKDSINLNSFERLITNRSKEENLFIRPSIYGLLTQAEYNIESSKHLSFEKKKEYSNIISSLYIQISADTTVNFKNSKYQAEIKRILEAFSQTKEKEGKQALSTLISQYESDVAEIQKAELDEESILDYLLKSPFRLIIILSAYITLMIFYVYYLRMRKRKKRMLKDILERRMIEKERIQMEIERLKELLSSEKFDKEERVHLEERLEMLFERLNMVEEKYYRQ